MEKKIKLPKTPAACADLLYKTREDRLRLQKEIEKFSDLESALKNYFIETLPKNQATGISGKLGCVRIETSPVPTVENWDKFYDHVLKTKGFHLLQRRLNEASVKELWEDKKQVPGVGKFNVVKVSCTAVK